MNVRLTPAWRIAVSCLGLAGLSACGGSAPLFTSDGRSTSQVQCPAAGAWETCQQHAAGICGGSFDTIQQSLDGDTRTLLFACRAPVQSQAPVQPEPQPVQTEPVPTQ